MNTTTLCVMLKESTFRKMSNETKSKWACSKICKFNDYNKSLINH